MRSNRFLLKNGWFCKPLSSNHTSYSVEHVALHIDIKTTKHCQAVNDVHGRFHSFSCRSRLQYYWDINCATRGEKHCKSERPNGYAANPCEATLYPCTITNVVGKDLRQNHPLSPSLFHDDEFLGRNLPRNRLCKTWNHPFYRCVVTVTSSKQVIARLHRTGSVVPLAAFMGQGPLHHARWIFFACVALLPLSSATAEAWAVVHTLWPARSLQPPFLKRITEESKRRCSWLMNSQWRRMANRVVCWPADCRKLACRDSASRCGLLAHYYWNDGSFCVKAVKRSMDFVSTEWFSCQTQKGSSQKVYSTSPLR